MKHTFRMIIGMLLIAIPLCGTAQVKPEKPEGPKPKMEKPERPDKPVMRPDRPEMRPDGPMRPGDPMRPEGPKPGMNEPKGGLEAPKISGFVQGLYQANFDKDFDLQSNTFRMRRVRMSVEGKLTKALSYKIQGDFSRSPMMVDAFLKYKLCNEFAIQVGQFKTPFTLESPINPVNLEIFDYGESVQKLVGYSDVCGVGGLGRDIGIMASGNLFPVEGKDFTLVTYSLGVFNGNGPCTTDNNKRKDIAGRLEVHPMMKDLTLSASFYNGKYKSSSAEGTRNRWSAGAQFNDGDLLIRAEYLSGTTGNVTEILDDNNNLVKDELYRNSQGYYAVAGYNLKVGKGQKLMPVVRYEHFAPGDFQSTIQGSTDLYTVGINYWPLKSVNFKLDYSLIQETLIQDNNKTTGKAHRVVGILSYKF